MFLLSPARAFFRFSCFALFPPPFPFGTAAFSLSKKQIALPGQRRYNVV
jgi:hypothetical protein